MRTLVVGRRRRVLIDVGLVLIVGSMPVLATPAAAVALAVAGAALVLWGSS